MTGPRSGPWHRRALLGPAVLAAVAVGVPAVGLAALAGGDRPTGGFLLLGSPFLLLLAGWVGLSRVPRARGTVRVRTVSDPEPATVFDYSAGLARCGAGACAAGFVLFAGTLAAAVLGIADGQDGWTAQLVIGLGGTGYLGWLLTAVLTGRLRRGHVALSPTGITHQSWSYTARTPWTAVTDIATSTDADGPLLLIRGHANTTTVERRFRAWRQPELAHLPHLAVRGAYLADDPVLLRHTLTRHLADPGARARLGTSTALDRPN